MSDPDVGRHELGEILAALREVVILIDRNRRIRYINRVEEGYERDDIMGEDALEFVQPSHRGPQAELFQRVLETREPASYEIPIAEAAGEQQWHEGRLVPLTRDGDVSGVVVVTRNVTERHRAWAEAEKLRSLVPVCSWCNKIRDDEGYWRSLEAYVEETAGSHVTHGICPECRESVSDEEAKKGT